MVITQEIYDKAKRQLHKPSDDCKVAEQFNFSESTARKIRCTRNYGEYVTRTKNAHRRAVRRENLARKQDMLKMSDFPKDEEEETTPAQKAAAVGAMIIVLCIAAIALVGAVRFVLWCFGV